MKLQILLAGRGGEGIIFMTRILTEGLFRCGHPVISTETHGMAMRGGSVISQVKVGGYLSPMIRLGEADLLLATSQEEAERNLPYLRRGGALIVNAPLPGPKYVDATGISHRLGNPRGSNLVLLGYALSRLNPLLSLDPFQDVVAELSPPRYRSGNLRCLEEGWKLGKEQREKDHFLPIFPVAQGP